jgi:predicted acylesterase/phospholipase RssA
MPAPAQPEPVTDPTAAAPEAPTPAEFEELRIAMALNGGVSLAVWMGGCAVELDEARRADPGGNGEGVYEVLSRCFGRRLVIDILTGASAGGINGALLGAAMVKQRQLDTEFVRNRWLELGDLSQILRDTAESTPPSLMRGDRFHENLLATFHGVLGSDPEAPGYQACSTSKPGPPCTPSLDVTMTDVIGTERIFKDAWGNDLCAREHRPRFKFRHGSQFTAEALATAARTSASFPIAFEPWRVEGSAGKLAGLASPTYGIDGGLLDNAPIKAALDLIPSKPATTRVLRYVCYLNADPPQSTPCAMPATSPTLRDVGAYTINLPRTAPFVDQLYAIQRAVERPKMVDQVQGPLLNLGLEELTSVANCLLPAYQQRRTTQSLEDLLPEPGDATAMNQLLDDAHGTLPWIPASLDPKSNDQWQWGVRPAQRILHLLLDLLRPVIQAAPQATRKALLAHRVEIDTQLKALDAAHKAVSGQAAEIDVQPLGETEPVELVDEAILSANETAPDIWTAVKAGVEAFFEILMTHGKYFEQNPVELLFGTGAGTRQAVDAAMLSHFFQRVLAIEVVRRAFAAEADIDSAQSLQFVQLTPLAPSPIFTSAPLNLSSPASADEKLTGVGLGHFAGFYRRSWRANDFMWGRLDAATRIVDLLLDSTSSEVGLGSNVGADEQAGIRSDALVAALVDASDPKSVRNWLLWEALVDAAPPGTVVVPDEGGIDELRELLKAKILGELTTVGSEASVTQLPFTRAVFRRAAQFEIVRDELPILRRESKRDHKLGSSAKKLKLGPKKGDDDPDARVEIEAVRRMYLDRESLPEKLTDPGEAVSDLGLRTLTHAAFVGLSAVRTAGMPLAKYFGLVRTPLHAVAGVVARNWLYRATVVFGFWAAAIFLTNRLATADSSHPAFSDAWSWATLAALAALLGVLGTAAVPGLRAWRGVNPGRNAACAIALVGFGVLFSAALAWIQGPLNNLEAVLFTPGAENPPDLVLLLPLGLLGAISLVRHLPLPGWAATTALTLLEKMRSNPWLLLVLLIASFALLGFEAGKTLVGKVDNEFWRGLGAGFALVAAPVSAAITVAIWKVRRPPKYPDSN